MKNKTYYAAYTMEMDLPELDGPRYYAGVDKFTTCENVVAVLDRFKISECKLIAFNIMPTKKDAEAVAECWNQSYKNNGTYI